MGLRFQISDTLSNLSTYLGLVDSMPFLRFQFAETRRVQKEFKFSSPNHFYGSSQPPHVDPFIRAPRRIFHLFIVPFISSTSFFISPNFILKKQ
jgi:hypothetical protein